MLSSQGVTLDGKGNPTLSHGNEHGDLPVNDQPPVDHPSENYASWRPTAIFSLGPFAAPPRG